MPAVEAAPVVPVIPVVVPAPRPVAVPVPAVDDVDQEQELVLEGLTRDQVRDWRVRAMKDPQLVFDRIDRYGAHGRVRRSAGRARGGASYSRRAFGGGYVPGGVPTGRSGQPEARWGVCADASAEARILHLVVELCPC
ncbi:hypothetical protein ACFQ2B_39965 [Streptomyces stramineus]